MTVDHMQPPSEMEDQAFEFFMSWQGDAENKAAEIAASYEAKGDPDGAAWWAEISVRCARMWADPRNQENFLNSG
jgi:hypothetical protein